MDITKITRQLDNRPLETINLEFDIPSDLTGGTHTETLKAYDGSTLVDTKTRSFTTSVIASYDSAYQNVLDAVTTNGDALPTASQRGVDNQIMIDYKATGAWVKDDCFFKFKGVGFGTGLIGYRLMDWKRLIKATAYGSLTWSDTGAKGNAANAYIDPLYVANDATNKWKANDAGVVLGISQLPTVDGCVFGYANIGNQKTRVFAFGGTRLDHWQLNNNTRIESKVITGLSGLYIDTTQQTLIKDSSESIPSSTQNLPTDSLYLLCYNDNGDAKNFTDAELSFVTFGADKRAEHAAIKTVLE